MKMLLESLKETPACSDMNNTNWRCLYPIKVLLRVRNPLGIENNYQVHPKKKSYSVTLLEYHVINVSLFSFITYIVAPYCEPILCLVLGCQLETFYETISNAMQIPLEKK